MIFPNIQAPSHHYRKKNNILFSLHETRETRETRETLETP